MKLDRRQLLAISVAAIAIPTSAIAPAYAGPADRRPVPESRKLVSPAVEAELLRVAARIGDPVLRGLWIDCFPNALDTTVSLGGSDAEPDAFIITGDIPCMWLRDSSCQVRPYLHLAKDDAVLTRLYRGLIRRQAQSIQIDPYANAFMQDPRVATSLDWARSDQTTMKPGVAERKWEPDSLLHPMRLAHAYWQHTGDPVPFDAVWKEGLRLSIATLDEQRRMRTDGPYQFQRRALASSDTLTGDGFGAPSRKVGLIHSAFRPSDDACVLPFHVPSNLFAVRALVDIAVVAEKAAGDLDLANSARTLSADLAAAVARYGTMSLEDRTTVYAYEVDGFGNALFFDDANIPSLSSLSYLGACRNDDPLFTLSAARAWSVENPWFFSGHAASGIGSPHTGDRRIWPMSLVIHALSSDDPATIRLALQALVRAGAGTGFMHEAFDADDPATYSRRWFGWANSLFAELILRVEQSRPELLA